MNLSSYQYTNQSSYPGRSTPLSSAPAGMYSGNNSSNPNIGQGTATTTPHAAMYATTPSSTQSSNYHGAVQPGGGGAPPIGQMPAQGSAATYNSYGGASASSAAGRPAEIFYSTPAMAGHPPGAGQPMYQTNAPATTVFQMGSSSSLAQAPAGAQLLSPQQQQQQQQQLNASAAAMAAYGNPATNINAGYKLFVGQVPAVCTEEQLRPLFSQFGRLLEIKIMREPNGRSRGSAWVRYESEISAQRAIEALNEKHVVPPQTNALRVQFATPNQNRVQPLSMQFQTAQLQAPQLHGPAAARTISAFIASSPQQQQHQQQSNYAATAYASAPQGYAPAPNAAPTAYLPQGAYASSNVISYGISDTAFAVRAPPPSPPQLSPQQAAQRHPTPLQQQQQQQQQQFSGRMEYLRAGQPGGGMLYTTSVSPAAAAAAAAAAGAMQQAQRQGPQPQSQQIPQQAQQQQQQQLVYTTGGQMRTGVVYAPEGFTMPNQMPSSQQQQQPQQWRH
jgi:RNA recognition motif-containing protein